MAGGGTQGKTKEWKEQVCSKYTYIKPLPVFLFDFACSILVLSSVRPSFNHLDLAANWLLPKQLVKEDKRLYKDFSMR